MELIKATDKFEKTEYSNYEDWETYPNSIYICQECDEKVLFSLKNLEKHSLSDFTNLSSTDAQEFDQFIENRDLDGANSFIDFYCPKCKSPVRIYYVAWAGGRHGEAGFILKYVVE
jgi:hypothetical protein